MLGSGVKKSATLPTHYLMGREQLDEQIRGRIGRLLPPSVFLLGLVLTAAAAWASQNSAVRETELLFETAAMAEGQRFEASLDDWIGEFDSAVSFVQATFPGTPAEFESFFQNSSIATPASLIDPGVGVIEMVELEDIPALEERERALGNNDFQVVTNSSSDGPLLVVTRSTNVTTLPGFSFVGRDLSQFLTDGFAENLASPDRFLVLLNGQEDLISELEAEEDRFGAPYSVVVDPIADSNRETIGWVVRSFQFETVADRVIEDSDLSVNVAIGLLGETVPIIDSDPNTRTQFDSSSMRSEQTFERSIGDFSVFVWADEDFGVPSGLFGQTAIWVSGVLLTLVVALSIAYVIGQRDMLESRAFELQHARTLASTDPLTGLLNRAAFIDLAEEMDQTRGGTVFFIDLDGFKEVNDTLGHTEGDRVLRKVSELIRAQFRDDDLVSRFGGDEFMIFTPGLYGKHIEKEVAERVVSAISGSTLGVTASVGAAERAPYDLTPIETMIRKADRAMYQAKQAGGDRFQGAKRK